MKQPGSGARGPGCTIDAGSGNFIVGGEFADALLMQGDRITGYAVACFDENGDPVTVTEVVIDIWVAALGAAISVAGSIVGSNPPTVAAAKYAVSSGAPFPDGDPVFAKNSVMRFVVSSIDAGDANLIQRILVETRVLRGN